VTDLLVLVGCGSAAGALGALLGLGGGVLIVPLLTLGFGLPFREAVGVSLVCVIATSSASASVYLRRDMANLRLGMTLELFTASAALAGGLIAFALPERVLGIMYAGLLAYVAVVMARGREPETGLDLAGGAEAADPPPGAGSSSFVDRLAGDGYRVRNLGWGVAGSMVAGLLSALLGIGGGVVKVPLMNQVMRVPLRVATATSNMMIGVTASSAGLIYLVRGGIDPYVAAPTALGVFAGAGLASRLAHRVDLRLLRAAFVVILAFTAIQMLARGVS
jgi:uncharacterized membrane protein YfcA